MRSKYWIERAIKKPVAAKTERADTADKTDKRARLAESLLKTRKEKG